MITPATANADGTLNMGTATIVESTTTYGGYVTSNTQANEFLYTWCWDGTTQGVRMKAGTIGGTSTAPTVTLGSMVQQDDRYAYYINTCYDSNVDRYCTVFYQSSSNSQTKGEVYAYTTSVSGTTPTVQNANGTRIFTSYDGNGGYNSQMTLCAFDPSVNRVLVKQNGITSDSGSTYKVMLQTIEVTTTGINGASNTPVHLDSTLSSSSARAQSESTGCLKYDPDGERMLVGYSLRGASDALTRGKLKLANVSSTSCALGAETTIGSDPCKFLAFGYDENIDKFGIYISSGSFGTSCDFYNMTYDGSDNITLSSKVVINGSYGYTINNNTGTIMPYVPTVFAMYSAIANSTTTFLYSFQSKQVVTTLNFDADRYLGVASTSATNGNEVQVNMPDKSINVDQTGLTIGEEYFTDNEGAVRPFYSGGASLTTGEYLGTAVSATDLQLKETPTELIGNSSASITKGKPVVVDADGDFTQAGLVDTAVSYSAGSQQTIKDSDTIGASSITYDDALGYFVVFYVELSSSNYGYARTYTESDKTLTLSQSLGAFHTSTTDIVDSVYIGSSVHIVFYKDNSNYLAARTVTIASNGTGTYGTENILNSSSINDKGSCYYDSSKDVVVITYSATSSHTATAMAVTVSGGTITAGTAVSTGINTTYQSATTYDENSNIGVYAYRDDTNTKGKVRTITLSGTGNRTITLNTEVEFHGNAARVQKDSLTYDPVSKKCFVAFWTGADWKTYGVVLTVSGTSVSAGTAVLIDNSLPSNSLACQATAQGGITVAFRDSAAPKYFKGVVATISGTSFSLSNANTLNSEEVDSEWVSIAYKSTTKSNTIIYVTAGSEELEQITTVPNGTIEASNLTTENYIGIAKSSSSAANKTAIITVDGGVDSNQSELTAGQLYYIQTDGTISTTAGSPSVVAGIGLSATKLLVTKS